MKNKEDPADLDCEVKMRVMAMTLLWKNKQEKKSIILRKEGMLMKTVTMKIMTREEERKIGRKLKIWKLKWKKRKDLSLV